MAVSIGIVGAGEIVHKTHVPVLFAMDDVAVSWITDVDAAKAKAVGRAYRVRHEELPTHPEELPQADVVLLAIPYGARAPYFAAFGNRGTAMYVEKPFARTSREHERLCSSFPAHMLACGFQRRSWGPLLLIRQIVEHELFGRLKTVRYEQGGPGIVVGGKYHADLSLAGGGLLFEMGVHGIDAIVFATGASDAQVLDARMITDGGFDLDTTATLRLTRLGGGHVMCDLKVSCLQETRERLEFGFEHGTASCSFADEAVTIETSDKAERFTLTGDPSTYATTGYQTFHRHWHTFLSGVRTRTRNATSATESLLTTAIVEKLYASAV